MSATNLVLWAMRYSRMLLRWFMLWLLLLGLLPLGLLMILLRLVLRLTTKEVED